MSNDLTLEDKIAFLKFILGEDGFKLYIDSILAFMEQYYAKPSTSIEDGDRP